MDDVALPTLPLLALDLVGVFVFALSGGLAAVRAGFDLLGVLVLAAAAGLGGGVVRDVLIGETPPVGITDWRLVAAACLAGALTFVLHPGVRRIQRFVLVLDGIGLGLFTVAGALKALQLGHPPLTAVIVGVVTGVGGGIIRDLLVGEVPQVLASRDLYATPALFGTALFATLWSIGLTGPVVTWGCVVLIAAVRLGALRRGWQAPVSRRPAG